MSFPYPDEPTTIKAYQDRVRAEYNAVGRIFPDPNDSDAFRWFTRYGYSCREMPEPEAANKHIQELQEALQGSPAPGPIVPVARPLIGPLKVQDRLFRDDAGFRRVTFCSWFPALCILRDNPNEFYRQLDAISAAGYQGFRTFLAVGGWSDFWDGREVVPIRFQKWYYTGNMLRTDRLGAVLEAWPDYDNLLRTMLKACRQRGLRLHVTTGDMQIIAAEADKELDLHRRLARICAEEGGLEVIAVAEVTNEFPINRSGSDGADSIAQMGRVIQIWEQTIPGILTMQGAIPQNEEPDSLSKASTHGDLCATHTTRSPFETALKRTFGLVYWEGNYRAFPKPFWQGEPAGPGSDSYQALNDPASLVALYGMHALTGQASVFFNGPSVRSREPLESTWGFRELPKLLMILPEDIGTWEHGSNRRGGIEYWWRGNQFATASFEGWDTAPPRPIAEWTLYKGTGTSNGNGTPPRATGLIVGTFA